MEGSSETNSGMRNLGDKKAVIGLPNDVSPSISVLRFPLTPCRIKLELTFSFPRIGANPSANLVSESDASVMGTLREQ